MKKKMGLQELAQYTYQGLKKQGIEVTLSGGACVSIYTENAYQSNALDFIGRMTDGIEKAAAAALALGFIRKGKHFTHPDSEFIIDFPPPPLTVGEEPPQVVHEYPITTSLGMISVRMLSPTDCVKDRLCGFFHWNDKQSLDQALMVAQSQRIDLDEIERWAKKEKMSEKHSEFRATLKAKKKRARPGKPGNAGT